MQKSSRYGIGIPESAEGEIIASDWAAGFLDVVALRPKAWEPLIEDDRAGIMDVADPTAQWRCGTQPRT